MPEPEMYDWAGYLSWVGTIILVIRGIPQAIKSWKDGHSRGLTSSMLWLWFFGSVFILPHLVIVADWATALVYMSNIAAVLVMLKYFYFPRKGKNLESKIHFGKKVD